MRKLFNAIRVAVAVYQADPADLERYDNFSNQFRAKYAGKTMTERYVREAYDQWRRAIIKDELQGTLVRNAAVLLLKDRHRQAALFAMALLVLAVLFPPLYVSAGEQTIHLGFAFAFEQHLGRIDAVYLLCEIVGIIGLYWLAIQFVRVDPTPRKTTPD
jgi:hypothetical protein